MKGLNLAIAALAGAAAGAAVALLFAPEKGCETRRKIREFVKEKCPFAKENEADRIINQIEEIIEREVKK